MKVTRNLVLTALGVVLGLATNITAAQDDDGVNPGATICADSTASCTPVWSTWTA